MLFPYALITFSIIVTRISAQILPVNNGRGLKVEFESLLSQSGPDPVAINILKLRNIKGMLPFIGGTYNVDQFVASVHRKLDKLPTVPPAKSAQKSATSPNTSRNVNKRTPT